MYALPITLDPTHTLNSFSNPSDKADIKIVIGFVNGFDFGI